MRSFALLVALAPVMALAQSPRSGRAQELVSQRLIVWISPTDAWTTLDASPLLSACWHAHCEPIVERAACDVPACPGPGFRVRVETPLAQVPAWPTDAPSFERERASLADDPELRPLHDYTHAHPDSARLAEQRARAEEAARPERERHSESVRWVSDHRQGDRFELGAGPIAATSINTGSSYVGGVASIGFVYLTDHGYADDHDSADEPDTLFNFMYGDTFGAEIRVRAMARVDGPTDPLHWVTTVGLAPITDNRLFRSVIRSPGIFIAAIPEIGVALRDNGPTCVYLGWDIGFTFLLDHDIALEVRPEVLIFIDWNPPATGSNDWGDDVLMSLSTALRLP